jgi:hypothetical protein
MPKNLLAAYGKNSTLIFAQLQFITTINTETAKIAERRTKPKQRTPVGRKPIASQISRINENIRRLACRFYITTLLSAPVAKNRLSFSQKYVIIIAVDSN